MSKNPTDIEIGEHLVYALDLKVKKNGRIDTMYGDKTPLGLYLIVKRIIDRELTK